MDEAYEFKLGQLAEIINKSIGIPKSLPDAPENGSACSIFLQDNRRDVHVLRASSNGSPFLGKAKLDTGEQNYLKYIRFQKSEDNPDGHRVGLTPTAIFSGKPVISHDLLNDPRCSQYRLPKKVIVKYEENNYCEYEAENITSLIAVPIIYSSEKDSGQLIEPAGVIRVVRNKSINVKFTEDDIKDLQNLIDSNAAWIRSSIFLSKLIELGTYTDLIDLCNEAAIILNDLFRAKGCSIFLLDEKDSTSSERIYKCFGTTGLKQRAGRDIITNPFDEPAARYIYYPQQQGESNEPLDIPITVGVIRARMSAFLDEISKRETDKLFTPKYRINRNPHQGQVSEYYWDENILQIATGKMLFAPMFFGDPDDRSIDVLGVVRIARTDNCDAFDTSDRHMFVSIVERLAEAVKLAKLVQFINNLATLKDYKLLFHEVVENIPKFIGGTDCALLILEGNKLFRKSEWKKGEGVKPFDGDDDFYDITDKNKRGFTGFVAFSKLPLKFNSKEELKRFNNDLERRGIHDRPNPSGKAEKAPRRFLGFPIVSSDKVLGVLRICKEDDKTPRFTNKDLRALEMIAKRLTPRLEGFHRDQQAKVSVRNIFSEVLEDKAKGLNFITCKDEIQNFFEKINSDVSIVDTILELQKNLWEMYRPDDIFPLTLFKKFDLFNKNILPDVPRYRDHFIHQFTVFLIGIVIIDSIYDKFIECFCRSYPNTSAAKLNKNDRTEIRKEIEKTWLITSLFHDIAYPLESIEKWVNNIVGIFLQSPYNNLSLSLSLDNIIFNNKYLDDIDRLVDFHLNVLKRDDINLRHEIIELLKGGTGGLDHGIISALLLLGESKFLHNDILPCVSAIALHNKLMFGKDIARISFENHPLAFLLIYSDLLHEWGRETFTQPMDNRKLPKLVELSIDSDMSKLKQVKQSSKKALKPVIRASITLKDNDRPKIEEVVRVFNRINSNEIDFYIKVNEVDLPDNNN